MMNDECGIPSPLPLAGEGPGERAAPGNAELGSARRQLGKAGHRFAARAAPGNDRTIYSH